MRNPDSLDVGEPGCKDNIELQHLNRSSLHFASLLSPAYWDRAWWRVEARRVGSDSPSVPAVVTAWWPRNDPDRTGAPTTVCLTCGAAREGIVRPQGLRLTPRRSAPRQSAQQDQKRQEQARHASPICRICPVIEGPDRSRDRSAVSANTGNNRTKN